MIRRSGTGAPEASPESQPVVIIQIVGEGGGLQLLGRPGPDGQWEYQAALNDHSLVMFESLPDWTIERRSGWTSSWNQAIRALDRYPWVQLPVVKVHDGFAARVFAEVMVRLDAVPKSSRQDREARWRAKCGAQDPG